MRFILFVIIWIFKQIKNSFKNIKTSEFYLVGSIILPFIAFTMSQFHLPHYIYVFFPFWMILTAKYVNEMKLENKVTKFMVQFQGYLSFLFIIISLLIIAYLFSTYNYINWIAVFIFSFLIIYTYIKEKGRTQLVPNLRH